MPDWVAPVLAVLAMLFVLVRNAKRAGAALPAQSSTRIIPLWILGTVAGTVAIVFLSFACWSTREHLRDREELELLALVLAYGLLLASGLYVWRRQHKSSLLRRGFLLGMCSIIPIAVYFFMRGRVSPVASAILLLSLLIFSVIILGILRRR